MEPNLNRYWGNSFLKSINKIGLSNVRKEQLMVLKDCELFLYKILLLDVMIFRIKSVTAKSLFSV